MCDNLRISKTLKNNPEGIMYYVLSVCVRISSNKRASLRYGRISIATSNYINTLTVAILSEIISSNVTL